MDNELKKSIDAMIDELFTEEENVEKSIDIAKDAKTTADAAVNAAPKGQDDEKRGAGRPKQISDVPKVDEDGKRAGNYDADIKERDGKEDENEEAKKQAKEKNQVKKSEEPVVEEILTKSEKEELEAFRAEKQAKETELKKAEVKKEQEDLIKSVIDQTASRYEAKIENLQKSLNEQVKLVKAVANAPQRAKSVTNINALEKSSNNEKAAANSFTKSEMLDVADKLFKSGKLRDTHVIELENNGFIYDENARKTLEDELKKL